jgi:outer membrane receptor for ferrienterochelin and colicins
VNVNNFTSYGTAVNLEYRTEPYQVSLGYSLTGRKNELALYEPSNLFFYAHEWRLNTSVFIKKHNLSFNYFCKFNGRFQIYQYNFRQNDVSLSYIDPFALMDFTVNKSMLKQRLSITVGLKNMLNIINVNANLSSGPHGAASGNAAAGMGRTAFVGINYNFL